MGVACLFNWPLPSGKSPTQAAEMLHKRIQALGAKESGTFAVDCETYQTQVADKETDWFNSPFWHADSYPLPIFKIYLT